ncbi:MAG: multicopper oxidase domain-containing protein [Phycisphaerae bacterium]
MLLALSVSVVHGQATVTGITGPNFALTAKSGYISGGDGLSLHVWGYANGAGVMQYPGPTLIVNQGDIVTITLTNEIMLPQPVPVSIVFPGQSGVTAVGGTPGLMAQEAPPDGLTTVTYTFTASHPGTYMYHSGTRPDVQVEMGLFGALIVRPAGFNPLNPTAYGHPDSAYDHEYLFLFSEMDLEVHQLVEFGLMNQVDTTTFRPVYWFINGRNGLDTILPDSVPWLMSQPYSSLPRMHPGERMLCRTISAGRQSHPFHQHGNNVTVIARDGRMLESAPGAGADLSFSLYTLTPCPGETIDAVFEWTGKGLGWDIYGHNPGDPLQPNEYAPDHGKPFPLILPGQLEVSFGVAYSGSPFLGSLGDVPPGMGGFNLNGGYFYPWHSHHEKEIVNNDIFPGGLLTFVIIEPPGVPIP